MNAITWAPTNLPDPWPVPQKDARTQFLDAIAMVAMKIVSEEVEWTSEHNE